MLSLGVLVLVLVGLRIGLHDGTGELPNDALLVLPEAPDPGEEELRAFSSSLLKLRRLTAGNKTQLAFVLLPAPSRHQRPDRRDQHERLHRLLDDRGIPYVDLRSSLSEMETSKHQVHPSDGHPDAYIHRHMAEQLLQRAPWDLWLQECPAGTEPVIESGSEASVERHCLTESGRLQGPYQRKEDGYLVASGMFEEGQRSGPWMEASRQTLRGRSTESSPAAVLERGDYVSNRREGLWRELVLPRTARLEAHSSGHEAGWPAALLLPELWTRLGAGQYAEGERTGRWAWVGPVKQEDEALLEVRCYEVGELVWTWKAKLGLDEEDDGRGSGPDDEPGEGTDGKHDADRGSTQDDEHTDGQDQDEHQGDAQGLLQGNTAAEENCSDRLDDDGDGETDCDDLDCSDDPACRHLLPATGGPDQGDDDSAEPESAPAKSDAGLVDTAKSSPSPEYPSEALATPRDRQSELENDAEPLVIFSEETIHYWDRGPATPRDIVSVPASRAWNFQCP